MTSLTTDVLVIGAGPAGSAAARTVSKLGRRIVLVDKHVFPRDKVCGDALIPDALEALAQLGLRDRVLSEARGSRSIRVYAPNGSHVELEGRLACLPRKRLDAIMTEGAKETGASLLTPYRLRGALQADGNIAGATFVPAEGGDEVTVHAAFTLLATGAAVGPLEAFGVCERHSASAMAARFYLQAPAELASEHDRLCISYDRHILPGYGWIFPGPDGIFNIGVGYFNDGAKRPRETNLQQLLARFIERFPPAQALMSRSHALTDVRGAPLRTALCGARLGRPGLLVIGEAAGLTYSFSGEGIGKSIASGIIAGEIVVRALAERTEKSAVAARYASRIKAEFAEQFRAYKVAQDWLARPLIANRVAKRANSNAHLRDQLEGLLAETVDPRQLFSVAGLFRALIL